MDNPSTASWLSLALSGLLLGAAPESRAQSAQVSTVAEVAGGTGGLVVDRLGNVYSADFGAVLGNPATAGKRLFRLAPDGTTSVFAEGFEGASGVAIDAHGNLFQSNIRGRYISKITSDGKVSTFASGGLQSPVGIVIDDQGTLWVANCGSGSIQKITRDGVSARFVESPLLNCPNGITLDDSNHLYVANFGNGDVIKITPKAEVSVLATLPGNNNGHIVHSAGTLYVVARTAHQIYKVSLTGKTELFAGSGEKGGIDGPRLKASFCFPNDIAVSPDGKRFYVNEVADESTKGTKLTPTRIRLIER